jgi:hypothetical protein
LWLVLMLLAGSLVESCLPLFPGRLGCGVGNVIKRVRQKA